MSRPRIRKSRPLTAAERQRRRRRKLYKARRLIARRLRGRARRRVKTARNLQDLGPIMHAEGVSIDKAQGIEIYTADIRKVHGLRSKITPAAVITDPPYEKNCLDLWAELARFSAEILPDKGWLVAMSGQRFLPRTLEVLDDAANQYGLVYCWTLAVLTPGAESAQGWLPGGRNPVNCEWKPVFVYSKGNPQSWPDDFRDCILSDGNDKRFDDWGQSLNVFESLVKNFAPPGSLVVDPFLGGGTTAVAAVLHGRPFEGFDCNETDTGTSLHRLQEALKQ